MPHVILEGRISIRDLWLRFEPVFDRRGDEIVKLEAAFADADARTLLVETLAVRGPRRQKYYLRVTPKGEGVTIRLEPLTDPEKTETVKRSLALFATAILRSCPGTRIASTNIGEFFDPPWLPTGSPP